MRGEKGRKWKERKSEEKAEEKTRGEIGKSKRGEKRKE